MTRKSPQAAAVLLLAATTALAADGGGLKGWVKAGSVPQLYDMAATDAEVYHGKHGAFIRSKGPVPEGFGTLMQQVETAAYAGKRVRLSAYLKADQVKRWAGLWMRVDGPYGKVLEFDNMQGRPIKGNSDWKRYEVVLDVAKNAQLLSYGLLLDGEGGVTMVQVRVDVVGTDIPTTSAPSPRQGLARPENLDFDQ